VYAACAPTAAVRPVSVTSFSSASGGGCAAVGLVLTTGQRGSLDRSTSADLTLEG
jgi:hypothetical protein